MLTTHHLPGDTRVASALLDRLWPSRLVLTFHGIGAPPHQIDPTEAPYWVDASTLAKAVEMGQRDLLQITFDDGNASDFTIALPMLLEAGIAGSFFILAGRLDRPGSLTVSQLQEMARSGMTIGSHGYDHVNWTKADDRTMRRELYDSRARIEECLGSPVDSISIPFGAFDRRVLELVADAGYQRVHTSSETLARRSGWLIPRHSITTRTRLDKDIAGWTSWRARVRSGLRNELRGYRYHFSTSMAVPSR